MKKKKKLSNSAQNSAKKPIVEPKVTGNSNGYDIQELGKFTFAARVTNTHENVILLDSDLHPFKEVVENYELDDLFDGLFLPPFEEIITYVKNLIDAKRDLLGHTEQEKNSFTTNCYAVELFRKYTPYDIEIFSDNGDYPSRIRVCGNEPLIFCWKPFTELPPFFEYKRLGGDQNFETGMLNGKLVVSSCIYNQILLDETLPPMPEPSPDVKLGSYEGDELKESDDDE